MKPFDQLPGDFDGEPGLAGTAGAGQCHETVWKQRRRLQRLVYPLAYSDLVQQEAERLDLEYKNRRIQAPDCHRTPSEHLSSGRIFLHTELGERGLATGIEQFGEDIFFCASDYPHEPKHEFPEAIDEFMERVDVPETAKRKILWDNPIAMYRLDESRLRSSPLPLGQAGDSDSSERRVRA